MPCSRRDEHLQHGCYPRSVLLDTPAVDIVELGRIHIDGEIEDELSEKYFARAYAALVALGVAGIPVRDAVDLTDW